MRKSNVSPGQFQFRGSFTELRDALLLLQETSEGKHVLHSGNTWNQRLKPAPEVRLFPVLDFQKEQCLKIFVESGDDIALDIADVKRRLVLPFRRLVVGHRNPPLEGYSRI